MLSPEQDPPAGLRSARCHPRYPLNSRRLTTWHFRALAKALGLPTAGSQDQLRQCVEGVVQRDHDYQNVMVVIRESIKMEYIIVLQDSEGEFLQSEPVYRDALHQRLRETEESGRQTDSLRQQLREAEQTIASRDEEHIQLTTELQEALDAYEEMSQVHECETGRLKQQLTAEKEKARRSWKINCEHLAEQDAVITDREEEIARLKRQVEELQGRLSRRRDGRPAPSRDDLTTVEEWCPARGPLVEDSGGDVSPSLRHDPPEIERVHGRRSEGSATVPTASSPGSTPRARHEQALLSISSDGRRRQGKAPPIEFFSGEDPAVLLDDWLPSLERASLWNGWSPKDKLMQSPGYLRGRALQEWRLLQSTEQQSYSPAIDALRRRLDPGSKIAAQEFRHTLQQAGEGVMDYIRHLEKIFQTHMGGTTWPSPPGMHCCMDSSMRVSGTR